MYRLPLAAMAILGCFASTPLVRGQAASPPDAQLIDVLRDVHNHGADLYNSGDPKGCYRLFEGALLTVKPMLKTYPGIQSEIAKAIDEADKETNDAKKAFVLHNAIESVRSKLREAAKRTETVKTPTPTPMPPKPTPPEPGKPKPPETTPPAVLARVVNDFFKDAANDKAINLSRGGKYPPDRAEWIDARRFLDKFLAKVTGNPSDLTVENTQDMVKATAAHGITGSEFDAAVKLLQVTMENNGVAPKDVAVVLKEVASYRKDIVDAVKPKPEPKPTPKPSPKPEPKPEPKPTPKPEPKPRPPASQGGMVKGTVKLDGKPAKLDLMFISKGSPEIRIYDVSSGADGNYEIKNLRPGKYLVVVPAPAPAAYTTATTTPLTAEVKPGDSTFDFNLSK